MTTQLNRTADRAFVVLSALAKGPATVTELARELHLNRTVVNRLLVTLQHHQLVASIDRKYQLSSGIRHLAAGVDPELRAHIATPMSKLADANSGVILFTVRNGIHSMVLTYLTPSSGTGVNINPDQNVRTPLVAAAHGLAMLAHTPSSIQRKALAEASTPDEITARIEQVRRDGIAVAPVGTGLLPLQEVAAPIIHPSGFADAAISLISTPDARNEDEIKAIVLETAGQISESLNQAQS